MTATLGWNILKDSVSEFLEDGVPRLAAALAYYALFSLGPLLVIVIAVAGLFFEKGAVTTEVHHQMESMIGSQAAATVETMLSKQDKDSSIIATVLGTVVLIFGATGVFGQLQDALNTIWEVKPKPGQGVWGFIRNRFLSFAMVLGIGFLLLVSMVITTLLDAFSGMLNQLLPMPTMVAKGLHFTISFVVIALLFAMIFKLLPDVKVKWRDVWVGALGTSLLFTIGKFLIAMYLGRQSTASAYGAAGSVVVVLLWVYYSSLILFFGAEFTQVYAKLTGSRIEPSANALPVSEETRAQQGIPHRPRPGAELEPQPAFARAAEGGSEPYNGDSDLNTPRGTPISVAGALGVGFIGGWIVHRKLTKQR